jgi:ribosomal protein S18 acetylase RimI-like enzyme
MSHPLDNPVWASLTSAHAGLASRFGSAARYPADVAPFVAVDTFDACVAKDLGELVSVGESILFVGPAPEMPTAWHVEPIVHIAQMVCAARIEPVDGPEIVELSRTHSADVLDLTARVYPHYFRPRTAEPGRYFGIYDGAKLAAITGERMRFDGHTELSAICTDPAYLGRGYAQRLVAMLANDVLDSGRVPFLHVSHQNVRAKKLYEHLGFRFRADIPLISVSRET